MAGFQARGTSRIPNEIEEHWTKPGGGTLVGMSRTLNQGKTRSLEFMHIEERGGRLVYWAQPNGQPPTEFTATMISADEVLFENPQHDMPKRIRYRRVGADRITATLEDDTGQVKATFTYTRR